EPPFDLVATRVAVACAQRQAATVSVRATARDGSAAWEWTGANVDDIDGAGDVVIVRDAARMFVLHARDGRVLGTIASDDGAAVRAAVVDIAGMTMVVTYEQGRVVARLPHVDMVPAWSIAVDGVVSELRAAGDGVLVVLED